MPGARGALGKESCFILHGAILKGFTEEEVLLGGKWTKEKVFQADGLNVGARPVPEGRVKIVEMWDAERKSELE